MHELRVVEDACSAGLMPRNMATAPSNSLTFSVAAHMHARLALPPNCSTRTCDLLVATLTCSYCVCRVSVPGGVGGASGVGGAVVGEGVGFPPRRCQPLHC